MIKNNILHDVNNSFTLDANYGDDAIGLSHFNATSSSGIEISNGELRKYDSTSVSADYYMAYRNQTKAYYHIDSETNARIEEEVKADIVEFNTNTIVGMTASKPVSYDDLFMGLDIHLDVPFFTFSFRMKFNIDVSW